MPYNKHSKITTDHTFPATDQYLFVSIIQVMIFMFCTCRSIVLSPTFYTVSSVEELDIIWNLCSFFRPVTTVIFIIIKFM